MGTIIERTRKDGSTSYRAQIVIKDGGRIVYQTSRSFPRRRTAAAWMERKEKELRAPGGLDAVQKPGARLKDAIDKFLANHEKVIGKTKAQVLRTIREEFDIADMACADIGSAELVEFAQQVLGRPGVTSASTVNNYMSHLSPIFAIANPAWGIPLKDSAMKDAQKICKQLGIVSKSKERDRRPTLDELNTLLEFFEERHRRGRSMPMHKIATFALFSTRRQAEITRIAWPDLEVENSRVLVRDMKHPGEKMGNDTWCELPPEALKIAMAMPRSNEDERIFPFNSDSVSAAWTRACQFLEIGDLRFHDLRHEGVSRLFEMGATIPQAASVSGHRSWQSLQRYSHIRASGDRFANWPWLDKVV